MKKTNIELVQEFFNYIDTQMENSEILQMEVNNILPSNSAVNINQLINEKLNSFGFEYNHKYLKSGELVIYKNIARSYVENNLN
jgi:hypothetical protein